MATSPTTQTAQPRPARAPHHRRRPRAGDPRDLRSGCSKSSSLHEISVDDLARGAGISRPTFYFYFSSKDAVLLTLLDRMVEEARANRGEALERFAEDPPRWLRHAITAIYETFRSHRAVSMAGADARATSAEVRELWARVMEGFVQETTAAIEAERARGAAPPGAPARDLAIALNSMNERVLQATFAGHAPTIAEEHVVDVLLAAWLGAIYGTSPAD